MNLLPLGRRSPPPWEEEACPGNLGARGGRGNDSDDSDDSANKKPAAVPAKRGGRGRGRPPLSSHGRGGGAIIRSSDGSPVARARLPGGRTPTSVKARGGRQGGRTPGSARSQGRGRGSHVQITPIRNPNIASLQEASPASQESDDDDGEEEEEGQSGSGEGSGDESSVASLYKITALGDSDDDEEKFAN